MREDNTMLKEIKTSIIIVALCILAGYLLLSFSYLIPAETMADEAYGTNMTLAAESTHNTERYSGRPLDNFTDALMLLTSEYPGNESIFDKAVNIYRFENADPNIAYMNNPYRTYLNIHNDGLENAEIGIKTVSYPRYWHGYQIFLRPLYSVVNYDSIRILNTALQFSLVIVILLLMYRRAAQCTVPFIIMLLFMAPTAIGKSLQYSSVYYVMLTAILLILWNPRNVLNDKNMIYLFLLSGAATAYLDLLTAPTISLTAPLCVYCVLRKDAFSAKELLKVVLKCSFFWFAGYAGMWMGKWILAAVWNGADFCNELLHTMKYRASSTSTTQVTRAGTLLLNIENLFLNEFVTLFALIYALIMTATIFFRRKKLTKHTFFSAGVILVISIIPVAWIVFLSNHSKVHDYFTYRTLCPAVFCFLTALSLNHPAPLSPSDKQPF